MKMTHVTVSLATLAMLASSVGHAGDAGDRSRVNAAQNDLYRRAKQNPGMTQAEFLTERNKTLLPEVQALSRSQNDWLDTTLKQKGIEILKTAPKDTTADDRGGDGDGAPVAATDEVSEEDAKELPVFGGGKGSTRAPAKVAAPLGGSKKPVASPKNPSREKTPEVYLDGQGTTTMDFSKKVDQGGQGTGSKNVDVIEFSKNPR